MDGYLEFITGLESLGSKSVVFSQQVPVVSI